MESENLFFRCIALFYFRKAKNATKTHKKIVAIYGDDAVSVRTISSWFTKFHNGNTTCKDDDRAGRPPTVSDDLIVRYFINSPRSTIEMAAVDLNVPGSTIHDHLKRIGFVSKLDYWVPHKLSEKKLMDRLSHCDMLLKRLNIDPFLKHLVTCDEKWVMYDNVSRQSSWVLAGEPADTTPKANIHAAKVMLCVWWDWKGIIYELLRPNQTITSERYIQQLQHVSDNIKKKRPALANRHRIVLQQDNARPHVSLATRQKLMELDWDLLPHPPYSPDLAPSDYHLFPPELSQRKKIQKSRGL